MLYWLIKRGVAEPVLKPVLRPWVRGAENVPATGPAVLASNHLSVADPVLLATVLRRRITFAAKADLFTGRGPQGRLFAGLLRGVGQLPVDRSGGSASAGAIDGAVEALRAGELFGIYPEGTRSPDGRLHRGRTGVARIALRSGAPVLPVAVVGTGELMPRGRVLPKVRRVGIVVGEPLDFSRYAGRADDQFVVRSVTDEVMAAIQRLSRQEYVDEYAARRGGPARGEPTPPAGGRGPGGRAAPPGPGDPRG
ncbi:1-acyl-sn-glycerol-3-phosphate acyltransferase [Paenibacillus sp. TRM 82003]|uniref:lysophospholipid acyltransferase family protein n=1 Tax=Kineococcus sp. TRM81007 TaxID=2925831 RepID=UPI001F57425F|nr:lysophospholipid acyltransferase family protein [Kineococcus sp. TRM81007]MCI2239672.1 1-acyl-sn-glycerol-3-phosphate acyltransferase [Kineococcus sp. TRM81007]MCI3926765.1 1-acyl-sn-glycerol-3-phosphate acyltransferase [Paenibacillus sp. TRM 82003]